MPPFEVENRIKRRFRAIFGLEDVEREHILGVLRQAHGKIAGPGGAAERLGMNRTTLNSRMQKLRISRKDF